MTEDLSVKTGLIESLLCIYVTIICILSHGYVSKQGSEDVSIDFIDSSLYIYVTIISTLPLGDMVVNR